MTVDDIRTNRLSGFIGRLIAGGCMGATEVAQPATTTLGLRLLEVTVVTKK